MSAAMMSSPPIFKRRPITLQGIPCGTVPKPTAREHANGGARKSLQPAEPTTPQTRDTSGYAKGLEVVQMGQVQVTRSFFERVRRG